MKLTKDLLKEIIREELSSLINERVKVEKLRKLSLRDYESSTSFKDSSSTKIVIRALDKALGSVDGTSTRDDTVDFSISEPSNEIKFPHIEVELERETDAGGLFSLRKSEPILVIMYIFSTDKGLLIQGFSNKRKNNNTFLIKKQLNDIDSSDEGDLYKVFSDELSEMLNG